jgi:hypothetical protein
MVYPIIKVQRHRYRDRAAKALNKRGITTGQGGRWHPQTVKRVIEAEGLIKGLPSSGTTGRLIVLSNLGSPSSWGVFLPGDREGRDETKARVDREN